MKPTIVYWTGSGNTQIMAEAIQEALEAKGAVCEAQYVSDVQVEDIIDSDIFYLGCPSMSGENVEEYEFRPFLEDLLPHMQGKPCVLFGSYDWGDREWMASWIEEMQTAGAEVVAHFEIQWEPNDEQLETIKEAVAAL